MHCQRSCTSAWAYFATHNPPKRQVIQHTPRQQVRGQTVGIWSVEANGWWSAWRYKIDRGKTWRHPSIRHCKQVTVFFKYDRKSRDLTSLTPDVVDRLQGYMPPEYYKARKYTNLSDVYGLGVVLLELLTGEKACDLERHAHNEEALLVRRIWSALRRGGWEALQSKLDPFIRYHPKQNLIQNLVNTALYCTEELETDRPDSKSLVEILENLRTFS